MEIESREHEKWIYSHHSNNSIPTKDNVTSISPPRILNSSPHILSLYLFNNPLVEYIDHELY